MIVIRKESLIQTCGGCPSQWDGKTDQDGDIYIRLRHGYFYIELDNHMIYNARPEGYDGVMGTEDMIEYVNKHSTNVQIR